MSRVIFLLEELSMKVLLEGLLPRLFPNLEFLCVAHDGKQDLEKSIPRKLKAWREPGVRFIIVRDKDAEDCRALKERLMALCFSRGRENVLVRIACHELEAWYFGDPEALAAAYNRADLAGLGEKRPYRDPDAVVCPSSELQRLVPEFQKVAGARLMGTLLERQRNRSRSFEVLLSGIEKLVQTNPVKGA